MSDGNKGLTEDRSNHRCEAVGAGRSVVLSSELWWGQREQELTAPLRGDHKSSDILVMKISRCGRAERTGEYFRE